MGRSIDIFYFTFFTHILKQPYKLILKLKCYLFHPIVFPKRLINYRLFVFLLFPSTKSNPYGVFSQFFFKKIILFCIVFHILIFFPRDLKKRKKKDNHIRRETQRINFKKKKKKKKKPNEIKSIRTMPYFLLTKFKKPTTSGVCIN